MSQPTLAGFKCFPQLNDARGASMMSDRSTVTQTCARRYFSGNTLQEKVVRALADDKLMPMKELLESFEFFQRIRKDVRAVHVADLCCGHGFVGMLFALFERGVERVSLIDHRQPDYHQRLLDCVARVGPWITDKVSFEISTIDNARGSLPGGTAVISSHACGTLTDQCMDAAIALGGPIAVMPCCYPKRACPAPPTIALHLGTNLAFDIDRTYRLRAAGYHVRWTAIPTEITHMNRILIGRRTSVA